MAGTDGHGTQEPLVSPGWRCFHCGEAFADRQTASDHFGLDCHEFPACVQVLTETDKAIVEDRREWRNRALQAEAENERLEHLVGSAEWDIRTRWKGARSLHDVACRFETLQGELLAARAQLQPAAAAFRAGYHAGHADAGRREEGAEPYGITHCWSLQADRPPADKN